MKKPLILLSPDRMPMEEPFREHYHITSTLHADAILRAGGLPVTGSYTDADDAMETMSHMDGMVMVGGADINPALYGQEVLPQCGELQPDRDVAERNLLRAAMALQKPVMCICRGMQLANVLLGGTLWQDLPTQRPGEIRHSIYGQYDREDAHWVQILPDTPLSRLFPGESGFFVNSLHHQAIDTLARPLRPMALSPDGLVESWYLPDPEQYLRGYQWHPEMLGDTPHSNTLYLDFIRACTKNSL